MRLRLTWEGWYSAPYVANRSEPNCDNTLDGVGKGDDAKLNKGDEDSRGVQPDSDDSDDGMAASGLVIALKLGLQALTLAVGRVCDQC